MTTFNFILARIIANLLLKLAVTAVLHPGKAAAIMWLAIINITARLTT